VAPLQAPRAALEAVDDRVILLTVAKINQL
jgi:hypothetical protein